MNLKVPKSVEEDPNSVEIARIWISHEKQIVSLNPGVWHDPAAWGLMFVDLARHVADDYAQINGKDPRDLLNRIRQGFDAEWSSPTDKVTGAVGK